MQHIDMRQALCQALDEELTRDERVFILGEEVAEYNGPYKVTKGLLDKFGPSRVIDTPISESAFSGLAIGAAMTGLRPVVDFMSFNFSFVAADQIISNAAKLYYMSGSRFKVPIVFRGPNGAAAQVSCQHSNCVESIYSNVAGLIIIAPSNAYDAKGLLKSAIRDDNPILFLESELLYGEKMEIPTEEYLIPIGKANIIKKGKDCTLISYSRMMPFAYEAAQKLEEKGISVELIDLRTIKPLDIETIFESVKKTNFCVIAEEGPHFGSVGSEITFQIQERCFDYLDAPVGKVSQKETPLPYSKVLEEASLVNVERIIASVENTVSNPI